MEVRDILKYPSGLYSSGKLLIFRQEGQGFAIKEDTHNGWVEVRRYDESGLLCEVAYEK